MHRTLPQAVRSLAALAIAARLFFPPLVHAEAVSASNNGASASDGSASDGAASDGSASEGSQGSSQGTQASDASSQDPSDSDNSSQVTDVGASGAESSADSTADSTRSSTDSATDDTSTTVDSTRTSRPSSNASDATGDSSRNSRSSDGNSTEGSVDNSVHENQTLVAVLIGVGVIAVSIGGAYATEAAAAAEEAAAARLEDYLRTNHALIARDISLGQGLVIEAWLHDLKLKPEECKRLLAHLSGSAEQRDMLIALDGSLSSIRVRSFASAFTRLLLRDLSAARVFDLAPAVFTRL